MAYLQKPVNARVVICSIDVGNSTSSVSFLYAEGKDEFKDLKNKVYRVDNWPDHREKNILIPSRLCYLDKKPYLYGENARRPGRRDKKWVLVESFKRQVNSLESNDVSDLDRGDFDPFPQGVTLRDIYRDWVAFLFNAGSKAFLESKNGTDVHADLWRKRICVFVVPNGWNEPEQAHLRELLHEAKCVEDCNNIRFARESEADLHYGLFLGFEKLTRPVNLSFFICNVGSSTGDLGFYRVTNTNPLHYEEVKPADSFPVATIVDQEIAAERDYQDPAPAENDYENMDPVYNVLKHLNKFRQGITGDAAPKYIVLEGGLGRDKASRERIINALKPDITVLTLSDANSSELPSQGRGLPTVDGALYSCIYNFITARKAPYYYGCLASVPFDKNIREHRRRREHGLHYIAGKSFVPGAWETIVPLGELIKDGAGRKKDFTIYSRERPSGRHPTTVVLYATKEENPQWVFERKSLVPGAREICKIVAEIDTDEIKVEEKQLPNGEKSFTASYTLDINFDSVTSVATVLWKRSNGMMGSKMASFSPPNDTTSDWHTNEHQGDKEDHKNVDDKGPSKTPEGNAGEKENNPPPPYDDDGKAVIDTGIYYVANPRNRHGLGQACWDSKKHLIKEWYLGFDRESHTFTIGPNLGGARGWEARKCPLTGYERDHPYDLDRVLAWQTTDSPPKKTYILSNRGGFAWTIASEAKSNHDYLEILLRPLDPNDINQIWELVPKPSR
ncbi:hypothetical protein Agabi119p4_9871 [Agaricus bisporus var. burnettii]|uniref:Uncharacterized protein n=1 Tax=Agaricus bisporus var. burnettii TaxID=192524 RepID=A0A8H7C385_AGABI|nr:hypothetical protein Agabi119p4_9871 [Agaricus bisporus var. burnettii]